MRRAGIASSRRMHAGALALLAALFIAGCSPADDVPGAVSADEAQQLNEAAAMLDANSVDLDAVNSDDVAPDAPTESRS